MQLAGVLRRFQANGLWPDTTLESESTEGATRNTGESLRL